MSDVCLILEGTYPYTTGGVSSCVYQLLRETPNLSYNLLYIGSNREKQGEFKYPIPSNVKLLKEVFLYDYQLEGNVQDLGGKVDLSILESFHQEIKRSGGKVDFKAIYELFFHPNKRICEPFDLLESKQAWQYLESVYNKKFRHIVGPSFIDFFYSWRFTHLPLFKVLSTEIPRSSVYHSLCTGYAGIVGVAAKLLYQRPFILSEHGIYSHEREIEIFQSDWIYNTNREHRARANLGVFKEWWINIFHFLSKVAYHHADTITTLFEGNKEKQIGRGADEDKIQIVPNGINVAKFSQSNKSNGNKKVVGLVGRVVPIKDIKTFIKAINIVKEDVDVKAYIIGPTDEDESYYAECVKLVHFLGMQDIIEFTGRVDMQEYYPKLDLQVLSSISEGQPMVILEGYAGKVPVVATDVGGCRDLIYGGDSLDRELGAAGKVVPFGRPHALAMGIKEVLLDDEKRAQMGESGYKRVNSFYREDQTISNYLNIYNQYLTRSY